MGGQVQLSAWPAGAAAWQALGNGCDAEQAWAAGGAGWEAVYPTGAQACLHGSLPLLPQVPSASLTPEQVAQHVEQGEEVPQYLALDVESKMSAYYKPGALSSAVPQLTY